MTGTQDTPPFRYTARLANDIELFWQDRWEREGTFHTPNPTGELAEGFDRVAGASPFYLNDMFPYPSGEGLHVGHPLGYIGTDVYGRYLRMSGRNVLHTMGFDAFGLPAEQYAVETGQHPRVTIERNIAKFRAQLRRMGLAHDLRRSVATADLGFYRWTQWIFLMIFNSWYDREADRARHVDELVVELDAGLREPAEGTNPFGQPWSELDESQRRAVVNNHRLAYLHSAPVNWCPGLGTVLANEEVTAEGRSDRGNFPVFRRPLKQWMLRITAYTDRLLADLDRLDWPDNVKQMQRNWIGRSTGAMVDFATPAGPVAVFTTRPDTLFGATYLVLAPEHPMVGDLTAAEWPADVPSAWTAGAPTPTEAVAAYQRAASRRSEMDRQAQARTKTGVFTGRYATNPVNGESIPVFVADYVLMGYGTGAIMAVPAQDERDWAFAETFGLPIVRTVAPPEGFDGGAYTGNGPAINSAFLDGLAVEEAKRRIVDWLVERGAGRETVTSKLRDWLFSRQRYWGEPFPIVYGADGEPRALPESMLPIELPDMDDFAPRAYAADDATSPPEPPLGRAAAWATVTLDLGDGPQQYRREVNTMPQWAGSCWYEIRYLDPFNDKSFVDPEVEAYWMGPRDAEDTGGVDLYVGGVEHAVLHLLYARFWHKVLFDLGKVSSIEPFRRLFNQGYVQAHAFTDSRGVYVPAAEVVERDGGFFWRDEPVRREFGKMGKSLKNSITPDDMYAAYGADTMRVYEMFTGPLDQSRPWDTKAVVGSQRLLQRVWRNVLDETTGESRVDGKPADEATRRLLHRTVAAVRECMESLRFNIAIARLTELNNHLTTAYEGDGVPREVVEPLLLMLAPLAPHMCEELWSRLGHAESLAREPFPVADPALLVDETIEIAVQINGKVRNTVQVATGADPAEMEAAASADRRIADLLAGGQVRKVVVVPGRLVNFVLD
ncbi:MAG TPA: leucine--tRNA ligase [Mycobacteriales bacterium]|nr:leucine--tRNA ligase [Mycobacteriales bacterium]